MKLYEQALKGEVRNRELVIDNKDLFVLLSNYGFHRVFKKDFHNTKMGSFNIHEYEEEYTIFFRVKNYTTYKTVKKHEVELIDYCLDMVKKMYNSIGN